ncbi:hypothetical protein [Cognatishimia maritima]|uniref:Uncharacterized protein n=1 Tax=Cognatishimia maritima TaxID=870908 RepID=A0A1M5W812_9RHOB|nr:hypothetical protein [Cognatishimia maritima]SHH83729.1 hypothetical protein SAMN04488044_0040 [Cognatishimia maritima]
MRGAIILLLTAAVATSACSRLKKDDGVRFDGQKFRIKATKASRDDRSMFVSTAAPASNSIEGAREAAAYGGTRYCIEQYGTSLIAWAHGPEAEPLFDGDRLVLEGQCKW